MGFSKIGIVGLGMIGGSIAELIHQKMPGVSVYGVSRKPETIALALEWNWIKEGGTSIESFPTDLDLVFVCTPISSIPDTVRAVSTHMDSDSLLITDVGSVKGKLSGEDFGLKPGHIFVGGHPMAGTQMSGIMAAEASVIEGCYYFLTPSGTDMDARLEAFLKKLNFDVQMMESDLHDQQVARGSHLPYLMSVLTKMAAKEGLSDIDIAALDPFLASGFRDTTRVAGSPVEWGVDICRENKGEVLEALRRVQARLGELTGLIEGEDWDGLGRFLGS